MDINRENYMIWITDFYDGTLSDIEKGALLNFLELNKDLKEEFTSFEEIKLHADISTRMTGKESLQKSIFDVDPELSEKEIEVLTSEYGTTELFIESASLRLIPEKFTFPDKNKLKRIPLRKTIIKLGTRGLAAAAGISILVSLILFVPGNKNPDQVYVASRMIPFNNSSQEVQDKLVPVLSDRRISPRAIRTEPREAVTNLAENNITKPPVAKREEISISPVSYSDKVIVASLDNIDIPSLLEMDENDIPLDYPNLSPRQFFALNFRKLLMKEDEENTEKLKAYEVADVGINGLNKLLGWEMQFEKVTDEEGRLEAYRFVSQLINIDRKTKIADD